MTYSFVNRAGCPTADANGRSAWAGGRLGEQLVPARVCPREEMIKPINARAHRARTAICGRPLMKTVPDMFQLSRVACV